MTSRHGLLVCAVLLLIFGPGACDRGADGWRFDVEEKPRDFSKIASEAEIAKYPDLFVDSADSMYTDKRFSAAEAIATLHRAPFGDGNIEAYRVLVQRMAIAQDRPYSTSWDDISAALQWRELEFAVIGGLANAKIPADLRADAIELLKTDPSISEAIYVESLLQARASAEPQIRERLERLIEYNKERILRSYERERDVRSHLMSDGATLGSMRYVDEGRTRVRLRIGTFHGLKAGDRLMVSVPPKGTPKALIAITETRSFESFGNVIEIKPKGAQSAKKLALSYIAITRAQ